jgi:hypothetical protein
LIGFMLLAENEAAAMADAVAVTVATATKAAQMASEVLWTPRIACPLLRKYDLKPLTGPVISSSPDGRTGPIWQLVRSEQLAADRADCQRAGCGPWPGGGWRHSAS